MASYSDSDPKSPSYPRYYPSIPYVENGVPLQTLSIWLPRPLTESSPGETCWIVYVHGGAWRDPAQTNGGVLPTIHHLFGAGDVKNPSLEGGRRWIAGIASINYRLSPYPNHPEDPSLPSDPGRNVKHPEHMKDVLAALTWLMDNHGVGGPKQRRKIARPGTDEGKDPVADWRDGGDGYPWIGVGHSCGSTLLLQTISSISNTQPSWAAPRCLILIAGIYDIPWFYTKHGNDDYDQIYKDIVKGAFGDDPTDWADASPCKAEYREEEWNTHSLIYLCHSPDDELVIGTHQLFKMLDTLQLYGWRLVDDEQEKLPDGTQPTGDRHAVQPEDFLWRKLQIVELKGRHDEIWQDGKQIADLIGDDQFGVAVGLFKALKMVDTQPPPPER